MLTAHRPAGMFWDVDVVLSFGSKLKHHGDKKKPVWEPKQVQLIDSPTSKSPLVLS